MVPTMPAMLRGRPEDSAPNMFTSPFDPVAYRAVPTLASRLATSAGGGSTWKPLASPVACIPARGFEFSQADSHNRDSEDCHALFIRAAGGHFDVAAPPQRCRTGYRAETQPGGGGRRGRHQ